MMRILIVLLLLNVTQVYSQTAASVGSGTTAFIENEHIRIEYDLRSGYFKGIYKDDGSERITKAYSQIDNYSSIDAGYKRSSTVSDMADVLGKGKILTVTHRRPNANDLIVQFTVYDSSDYVVMKAGIKNLGKAPVRVKEIIPIRGEAFEGFPVGNNFQTLDGNSGWQGKMVTADTARECSNNILAMFEKNNEKHTLLLGGLTYHDYIKTVSVSKKDKSLQFKLRAADPYGRKVGKNETYIPADKFYINFTSDNPFAALEEYGYAIRTAQNLAPTPYTFPVVDLWYAWFVNKSPVLNNSAGAVTSMEDAVKSGFLKYSKVGIMLEPDDYSYPSNEQGWWDDKHFQQYKHYVEPYETTAKWAGKVTEMGGVPLVYFQTSRYSEDYAKAFPKHMLFDNKKLRPKPVEWWADGTDRHWGYDFTNPGFLAHMNDVYSNLRKGGVKGVKFDYPTTGWAYEGGYDNDTLTTANHFKRVFELPQKLFGKETYVSLRGDYTDDLFVGSIDAVRLEMDNDVFIPHMARRGGLSWYKNRVIYHTYLDAKDPADAHPNNEDGRRAMFTMTYVVSSKLMLGVGFRSISPADVHLISRTIPYHTEPKSARPLDAFSGKEWPEIYDFEVNNDWHQLTLYNAALTPGQSWVDDQKIWLNHYSMGIHMIPKRISVSLSGKQSFGGMALDPHAQYYIYDFWNDTLATKLKGSDSLSQELRPGEARMLSVHKVESNPQFISTNRHIMQGYVDMTAYPKWDNSQKTLSGTSNVIGDETYKVVIACNGSTPVSATVKNNDPGGKTVSAKVKMLDVKNGLARLEIDSKNNCTATWTIVFK